MLTMAEARAVKSLRRYGQMGMTCVYRLYDDAWNLLYVGVTQTDLAHRFNGHSRVKEWWPNVTRVRIEWHTEVYKALDHERESIRNERPQFNIRSRVDPEPLANGARTVPDLAYARGAGSREQGGRSRDVGHPCLSSHQRHPRPPRRLPERLPPMDGLDKRAGVMG